MCGPTTKPHPKLERNTTPHTKTTTRGAAGSLAEQVDHVTRVKSHRPGTLLSPSVLPPTATVSDAWAAGGRVLVTRTGEMGGLLLGVVTPKDTDFVPGSEAGKTPLSAVMTPLAGLATAPSGSTRAELEAAVRACKRSMLPLVDPQGALQGVASRAEHAEATRRPALGEATVDAEGRMRVGAAVGTRDSDREKVAALVAGVRLPPPLFVASFVAFFVASPPLLSLFFSPAVPFPPTLPPPTHSHAVPGPSRRRRHRP